jgi:serine/threonine protein phosphatase PrpC/ribosomal protein L39E
MAAIMAQQLHLTIGQFSDKGRKETNQDFHGTLVPEEPLLSLKGAVVAIADGISSSKVSRIAAESAIKSFVNDYFCTSEAWSVKTSAQRVIAATNSWLYSETRRSQNPYDQDKGYVCTLSVMVLKSATAHLFHIGDSRIYRLSGNALEQLTEDHRIAVSSQESYLSRALGVSQQLEIDYRAVPLEVGDTFLLATDGVYEHVSPRFVSETIRENSGDLDHAARIITEAAYQNGSGDNLTLQIVRVNSLPTAEAGEHIGQAIDLPPAPLLEPRQVFDGYRVLRPLHANSRSHIFLAEDMENGTLVALKIPSLDLRGDAAYLKRFMMEEWIARRLNNAHVLKPVQQARKRNFLYVVSEFVEGQTLTQWMIDNPGPDLETVRGIVEQIAKGLRAFHRKEMLHQDLRPANIMIDKTGTVKIIDFGSTRVAGVLEAAPALDGEEILGTVQYTAPEYFVGESGTNRSDLFSLGVITYEMLTGRLPYGARVAMSRTKAAQRKLRYASALDEKREIPFWLDAVLEKAVQVDPLQRYAQLSEFLYDLRHPNKDLMGIRSGALLERNPLLFWQLLSLALALGMAVMLFLLIGRGR